MTKRELYEAIGQLDAAYCRQALRPPEPKHAPNRLLRVTSAAAAAAVCIAAVGSAVWFISSVQSDGLREGYGDSSAEFAALTETEPVEIETDPAPVYGELELHKCLDANNPEDMEWLNTVGLNSSEPLLPIDTAPYIARFTEAADAAALNTLECKSYVYHMMLNSVDYYRTAQGTLRRERFDSPNDTQIVFQTDIAAQRAYEKQTRASDVQDGSEVYEIYTADGIRYECSNGYLTEKTPVGYPSENRDRDNARCYRNFDGLFNSAMRGDLTNLGLAHTPLLPQQLAMYFLWDFDTWEIAGCFTQTALGREEIEIEGETSGGEHFWFQVDLETGILLAMKTCDQNGVTERTEITSLEIDTELAVRQFDPDAYERASDTAPQGEISYAELELHTDTPIVRSMAETLERIQAGRTAYEENPRSNVIDTAPYIATFMEPNGDPPAVQEWLECLNSQEYKSYLYHMMINSVDYFDTAQGTMTWEWYGDEPVNTPTTEKVTFQTNMRVSISYEKSETEDGQIAEHYTDTGWVIYTDGKQVTSEGKRSKQPDFIISDNERVVTVEDGESYTTRRPNKTLLDAAGSCLFPQDHALSHLSDFDTWEVTGTEDIPYRQGTTCAVIEGTHKKAGDNGYVYFPFKMYVDVSTGIMMKYEMWHADGTPRERYQVTSLEADTDFKVKMFDSGAYLSMHDAAALGDN